MTRRRITRSVSILVIIAICGGMYALLSSNIARATDPFEQMIDEYVLEPYSQETLQRSNAELKLDDSTDFLTSDTPDNLQPISNAVKIDRYIVKYKNNRETQFLDKAGSILERSEALTPFLSEKNGSLTAYNKMTAVDTQRTLETNTIALPTARNGSTSMQVLILSEAKLPSEFAAELRALGADADIEYIQPDFKLSLDSISLDLVGGTSEAESSLEVFIDEDDNERDFPTATVLGLTDTTIDAIIDEIPAVPVTVAVIDTGIDTGHEIFEGYLHEDAPDTPTNNLSYSHGSHVSGIIVQTAQETNASIKLLPIKVFTGGNAYTSDIIAAIEYAMALGAQIINCSFGNVNYNQALYDVVAASDALLVCAVGNNRRDFDVQPSYPAGYDLPNIISVASTNADDGFSYYSNYGESSIDIAAFGREVYSALPGNRYGLQTGTSMSAAYVTGAAAATLSYSDLSTAELKARLLNSADGLSNLENKVVTGKRLNLANAILGVEGSYFELNPAEDFDVHGYQRTDEENWQLFSGLVFTKVSAGGSHSLALTDDGRVWAWGLNTSGQLGDGTTTNSGAPVQVVGLSGIVAISAGENHSLALKSNGTLWGWGCNDYGRLGDGTETHRSSPVQVSGLTGVTDISAGYMYSSAIINNGNVYEWGAARVSFLNGPWGGLGTTGISPTPQQVDGVSNISNVSAGNGKSIAADTSGNVWYWERTFEADLNDYMDNNGYPEECFWFEPVSVYDVQNITAVSAGDSYHFLTLKNDGTVRTYDTYSSSQVNSLSGITRIDAGSTHSFAVKSNGMVYAWGTNTYGQLGDGTTTTRNTPVQLNNLNNIIEVSAGISHSLAIDNNGIIWAWGRNNFGQLGDETTTNRNTPVEVSMPLPFVAFGDASYDAAIADSGTSTIQTSATAYDEYRDPVSNASITYSLVSAYSGVSINSSTGLVTISASAQPGTVSIKATWDGIMATVPLKLSSASKANLSMNVTDSEIIRVALSASALEDENFEKQYLLSYDNEVLELLDFAEQTYGANVAEGAVEGTDITIEDISSGTIVFSFDKDVSAGKVWSGVLTLLKFRAISSGNTTVTLESSDGY